MPFVAALVILAIALATIASHLAMVPRWERQSRIWFYTVGIIIVAAPWTLWAMYRGYQNETIATLWLSAVTCGGVAVMVRWCKRELARRDKGQARKATEHEV